MFVSNPIALGVIIGVEATIIVEAVAFIIICIWASKHC